VLIWVDAQLSPALAPWLSATLGVRAVAVKEVGLRDATDAEIFASARAVGAIMLTKDADFVTLLMRHGIPPQIIWLTCGNTSNAALRQLLSASWPKVASLLESGEALLEVSDRAPKRGQANAT
jgi:predicted nuclease of predicted toxin-antitoxin system